MNFTLPEARRERMEQLLEYLGSRAEDFKKCFDIESEWCWKYADLALRGIESRDLEYAEGHHIVPASFYGKRGCKMVDDGNLTVLTYGEHLWAHYCLVWCATGKMQGKMATAFMIMYGKSIWKKHALMPSEAELLDSIPEMEIKRIQAMEPQWAKVEAEGRTHKSEDPKQYAKDYREANKEKLAEYGKARYEANKETVLEYEKAYREANKGKLAEKRKAYREANKDKIAEWMKAYCEANKEKLAERKKAHYEANKGKILEQKKAYREANREMVLEQKKSYYAANKEKIAERKKARYEANREKILEQKKAYREANREKIQERDKAYREANKEKIAERKKARYEANREKILEQKKAYHEANKEKRAEYFKAWREAKKGAGYRYRKNPITGKFGWVFVGLPEQEVAA